MFGDLENACIYHLMCAFQSPFCRFATYVSFATHTYQKLDLLDTYAFILQWIHFRILWSVTFECLVLSHLKTIMDPLLNPLQFAYRTNRSVNNAAIVALHFMPEFQLKHSYPRSPSGQAFPAVCA